MMTSDIETEATDSFLPLRDVPKLLADRGVRSGRGKRLHSSTIHRWATRGVRGVVLQTWRVGGTRYTSIQALNSFIDAISQPEPHTLPRVCHSRQASRASAEARAILGGRRGAA